MALVNERKIWLMPGVRPAETPFVVGMCIYAQEIAQGNIPGPYAEEDAVFWAEDFARLFSSN